MIGAVKENRIKIIVPIKDPDGKKIGVIDEKGNYHFYNK